MTNLFKLITVHNEMNEDTLEDFLKRLERFSLTVLFKQWNEHHQDTELVISGTKNDFLSWNGSYVGDDGLPVWDSRHFVRELVPVQ